MKNCKKIHALLPLYAESRLFAPEKAAVESHLRGCADAREELKQLQHLGRALKNLPEPKMPAGLHDHIMSRVHGKPAPADNRVWLKTTVGLAAAAGLAFIFFAQDFNWLNHSVALKPASPASLNSAPVAPSAAMDDLASEPTQKSNTITLALSRPLDARVNMKYAQKVVGLNHNLSLSVPAPAAPAQIAAATAPMVLAMGAEPQPKKRAMAFAQKNSSFDANLSTQNTAAPSADYAAGGNDFGQAEAKLSLKSQTETSQMADLPQDSKNYSATFMTGGVSNQSGDKSTPQILRLEALPLGAHQYRLTWETDLVTKGQILIMDSTGNTLQAASETTDYAYAHQMNIDTTPINTSFSFKLIATYLNGNQAVTVTQPLNATPAP